MQIYAHEKMLNIWKMQNETKSAVYPQEELKLKI